MGLVKCPICELNYMDESQKSCEVCRRGKHGEPDPMETGICPACGERPSMRGQELCIVCQKEQIRQQKLESLASAVEDGEEIDILEAEDLDEIDDLTDIEIDDTDIPESEYEEIHRELGDGDDFLDEDEEFGDEQDPEDD